MPFVGDHIHGDALSNGFGFRFSSRDQVVSYILDAADLIALAAVSPRLATAFVWISRAFRRS